MKLSFQWLSFQGIHYWIPPGVLMGLGLIAFSLACIPFVAGAALFLYGLKRRGPEGLWLTFVAMGLTPALILVFDYVTADPTTTWVPDSYLYLAAFFGVIALGGLALGVLESRRTPNRGA